MLREKPHVIPPGSGASSCDSSHKVEALRYGLVREIRSQKASAQFESLERTRHQGTASRGQHLHSGRVRRPEDLPMLPGVYALEIESYMAQIDAQ